MGRRTNIEWADSTLNLWFGCTKVSPACDHCYAEAWAKRSGLAQWGPQAERVRAKHWLQELEAISRLAARAHRPWFVFVNSLSDIFDNAADPAWRAEAFAAFRMHPHLTFVLCTKRIGNAEAMIAAAGGLPPNCAILVTVIDQDEANRDVPRLLALKAKVRPAFVGLSLEPLLGPVDLQDIPLPDGRSMQALRGSIWRGSYWTEDCPVIDWVIVGFESGPGARVGHPAWARDLRDQCSVHGSAFLFKQWGEYVPVHYDSDDRPDVEPTVAVAFNGAVDLQKPFTLPPISGERPRWRQMAKVGKKAAGRRLDGQLHDARPSSARALSETARTTSSAVSAVQPLQG